MSISIDINQVKVEYPVLRKAVDSNLTVLFTDKRTGVVLVADKKWSFGERCGVFKHSEDIYWVKVEGTIRG